MRRRVARKIEKRINAGAPCPRAKRRGYRESTRATARSKLYPRRSLAVPLHYGPSHLEDVFAIWHAYDRHAYERLRTLALPSWAVR